jgi:hypothetical protein
MLQQRKQASNILVQLTALSFTILDVEFTLNKNEEYESSRREKMVKESYLAAWLLQRME